MKSPPPAAEKPNSTTHLHLDNALLMLAILREIPRKRYIHSSKIREHLQQKGHSVSLRTVQRYLDALSHHFPIECDQRSKPYGYRWLDGASGLNLPYLTPAESLTLLLAQRELAPLLPTRLYEAVEPLLGGAALLLNYAPDPPRQQRWLRKVQRIPDSQPLLPAQLHEHVLEEVSQALYEECMLELRYQNARGENKEARVMPLGLVQQGVRMYLVAQFDGYSNHRILALPRILHARTTDEHFTYPQDFDLNDYTQQGHFGIRKGEAIRLRLCIDPIIGQHLSESPLSADQSIVFTDEGLVIDACVVETELLHRWLRSWGDAIRWVKVEKLAKQNES